MRNVMRETEQKRFTVYYNSLLENGSLMFAGKLLQRAAEKFPITTALICGDESVTFRDLYARSLKVSKKLQEMGVKPRDRVCLIFENSIEFYLGYFGIWQTGAVVVPLNTFLHEKELYHIIKDAKPVAIIASKTFEERLAQLDGETLPPIIGQEALKQIAHEPFAGEYTIPALDADEMAALLYTSGTTGLPKGVMLSSKNILTNVVQSVCRTEVSPKDRVLAALPLFHSFAQNGCVWSTFFIGATTIVIPRVERRPLLRGLAKKPTVIAGVPALYGLFCLMKTVPFPAVRYFVCGGDALPDKIRVAFELLYRRRLCNGYGLTEASPVICANLDDELLQPNTVGTPSIGLACSLRDEMGNEVPQGQKGILWVKGDNVMLGYFNAPEATAKVLKDGWLDTGDWAFFDEKGRLVIAGRHKDLIIHKGFNIYPQEIENVLMGHPDVMLAAVVGKGEEGDETPVAFVVLKEGASFKPEALKKLCMHHLAPYKVPKDFIQLDEMPLTSLRKVNKKKLRREHFGG